MSAHLTGILTHAGTMNVAEDTDQCGVFIKCTEESIKGLEYLPMYNPVSVVAKTTLDELVAALSKILPRAEMYMKELGIDENETGPLATDTSDARAILAKHSKAP